MLYFARHGTGLPPLVFVHGYTCDHADWRFQLADLAKDHTVVACDLRGHGQTPGRPADCSVETYGADVVELLAALELKEVILVGHSLGCRVVLEAAQRQLARLAGVVLIEGFWPNLESPKHLERTMHDKISAMGFAGFITERFTAMFPFPNVYAEPILARARRMPPEIGANVLARAFWWDGLKLDPALAGLKLPALVIQSAFGASRLVHETESLDRMRRLKPDAQIEVVPGVGHFTQLEAPETVGQLIRAFVARLR
ncbi:MAG TPA: alpha/beta hydrolase [Opitutales bacterium]|nr:alpha/beta hydrolase [Opitutales bacterium]